MMQGDERLQCVCCTRVNRAYHEHDTNTTRCEHDTRKLTIGSEASSPMFPLLPHSEAYSSWSPALEPWMEEVVLDVQGMLRNVWNAGVGAWNAKGCCECLESGGCELLWKLRAAYAATNARFLRSMLDSCEDVLCSNPGVSSQESSIHRALEPKTHPS